MGGHVDKLAVARVNLLMAVVMHEFQVGVRIRPPVRARYPVVDL